jgi:amino-acid N-acetyltransferase
MYDVGSESLTSFVASELGANKIIFFTATCPGLMTTPEGEPPSTTENPDIALTEGGGKVLQSIRLSDAKRLLDYNNVLYNGRHNGRVNVPYIDPTTNQILPDYKREALQKIGHSVASLQNGVLRAHLISPSRDGSLLKELFTRDGSGMLISRDLCK